MPESFEQQAATAIRNLTVTCGVLAIGLMLALGLAAWGLDQASSAIAQQAHNQAANTSALCSFRADLRQRVTSGEAFLASHPRGIPGIPASTIRVGLNAEQATLHALRALAGHCHPVRGR